ncbi:hydrolase, NUDIX family [Fannyhessea vaginae PB189-T1-4]|uniref:Hydrolase, NUDIX family n=1 Tax=Fannyhessea vaginae PB189-T1-4 TaxID=866774 RepID=A0ABN0B1K3_9ACTN|nr:NUDIX hydrolase [Fannyhessea vaginae]EFL44638.1 hydrolase, NUDIX family [Fannyhessea vaginae PB189-T1-4]
MKKESNTTRTKRATTSAKLAGAKTSAAAAESAAAELAAAAAPKTPKTSKALKTTKSPKSPKSPKALAQVKRATIPTPVAMSASAKQIQRAQAALQQQTQVLATGARALLDEIEQTERDDAAMQHGVRLTPTKDVLASIQETPIMEQTLFEGLIFNVNRVDVRLPNGSVSQRDIVRHSGAVGIVALTDSGKICLVRQWRATLDRATLEIPAGKLEPGEDPLACAKRELKEETGMTAGNIAFLTTLAPSIGCSDELIHLYMATDLSCGDAHPDADEFVKAELIDLDTCINLVLDGRIEDAKTVVGALICDAISRRLPAQITNNQMNTI